ncbi:hypothetical protein ACFQMN_01915 [Halobacillus campisalis]|uniref:Uncharacterized protein n=1 Tax=Halobacillus campisalis TaxID=435909 RepID=A0ABW2K0E7_9BACI
MAYADISLCVVFNYSSHFFSFSSRRQNPVISQKAKDSGAAITPSYTCTRSKSAKLIVYRIG